MDVIHRGAVSAFVTKDSSIIREILSRAEATLPPGAATEGHFHPATEEIYYILSGAGRMQIGAEARTVAPGDGVAIPPGAPHQIVNTGPADLVFLCCCVPAYTDEDTVITEMPSLARTEGTEGKVS